MIEKHVMQELPFLASENIIMSMVKLGANRQVSVCAVMVVKHASKILGMS